MQTSVTKGTAEWSGIWIFFCPSTNIHAKLGNDEYPFQDQYSEDISWLHREVLEFQTKVSVFSTLRSGRFCDLLKGSTKSKTVEKYDGNRYSDHDSEEISEFRHDLLENMEIFDCSYPRSEARTRCNVKGEVFSAVFAKFTTKLMEAALNKAYHRVWFRERQEVVHRRVGSMFVIASRVSCHRKSSASRQVRWGRRNLPQY